MVFSSEKLTEWYGPSPLLLTISTWMPKTDTSEENGSPKRRYIPRPCMLCTLNISDHYLDELEAKIKVWVDMFTPAMDTIPSGLKEKKKSEDGQSPTLECMAREG